MYPRGFHSFLRPNIKKKTLHWNVTKCMSSIQATTVQESEYTSVPEYPELIDPSVEGKKLRQRQAWYKQIEMMPTVDQKLYEIARQKRHSAFMINVVVPAYGSQPFLQHVTRTHLIKGLPKVYDNMNVDGLMEKLHQPLLDCILFEMNYNGRYNDYNDKRKCKEMFLSKMMMKNIISVLMSSGVSEHEHLLTAQVQEYPRIDYSWWNGKFFLKSSSKYSTTCFQTGWKPAIQIYSQKPFPQYLDRDDPICATADVPECAYHPKVWRLAREYRYLTCVPGYWSGTKNEYPLLAFEKRDMLQYYKRKSKDETYNEKVVDGIGIAGLFSSLGAVAAYQGFTPFHELTYPITSQLIVTDGRLWTFLAYQLNTICLHPDVDTSSHRNICWSSGPMELYETVENGQLKGVNDEVLKMILKFFFREPAVQEGINLKPYLGEDKRELSEIQECRVALRKLYDNRLDQKLVRAEVPTWHWVYKKNPVAPPSPRVKLW